MKHLFDPLVVFKPCILILRPPHTVGPRAVQNPTCIANPFKIPKEDENVSSVKYFGNLGYETGSMHVPDWQHA